jgi:hypothetical protein
MHNIESNFRFPNPESENTRSEQLTIDDYIIERALGETDDSFFDKTEDEKTRETKRQEERVDQYTESHHCSYDKACADLGIDPSIFD